jgi:NMD protein affecting ribosome stability and mRNA decay
VRPTKQDKGLIRSLNRASVLARKGTAVETRTGRLPEPAACEACGAVFSGRTWRLRRRISDALIAQVHWTTCPGCTQSRAGSGFGRVLARGSYVAAHDADIRRRIRNVVARASASQPLRRLSAIERSADALEIITTSQKLAHRIARELRKAFGGRVSYAWSDDGTLFATWTR